jgi:hypothetical protein
MKLRGRCNAAVDFYQTVRHLSNLNRNARRSAAKSTQREFVQNKFELEI